MAKIATYHFNYASTGGQAPTSPSLEQIVAQAAQKTCNVARDQIREAATLPMANLPGVPTTSSPIPILPSGQIPMPGGPTDDFWRQRWR